MVNSSPGTANRSRAVVLALLAVTATVVCYFCAANGADAGPARAASATAAPPRDEAPATPSSAAGVVERREATPMVVPDAPPSAERTAQAPAVPEKETAATVHGRVVDVRGIGIADAKVAVLKQDQLPAGMSLGLPREVRETGSDGVTSDAAGQFVLALRTLGPFELIASHDEHPSTRHGGTADGPRIDGVIIVLRDGGSIAGSIDGAPADAGELTVIARHVEQGAAALAGAAATAVFDFGGLFEGLDLPVGARRTAAAADRTFRLNGLETGARFAVFALRKVQEGQWTRCTERVEASEGAQGVQLRWRETLAITVRVIDAETGAPIEDLDVAVGPVTKMVVLGMSMPIPMRQPVPQRHFPGGIVQLDGIGKDDKNPTLSLEVRAPGRRSWSRDDLDGTDRGRLDLGVVQLAAAPVVRVTVVCGAEPVAGAKVRIEQTEGDPTGESGSGGRRSITFSTATTTSAGSGEQPVRTKIGEHDTPVATDERGVAELTADFGGKARVVVESSHHATCRGEPFALPARGVVEQHVVLWRGGTASVRVVDGHGAPLANTSVRRTGAEANDAGSAKTDAHGALVFERLSPGAHSFAIEEAAKAAGGLRIDLGVASATEAEATAVEIGDGQVVDVLLKAPLRGSLRGIVTLDGQPLDRAEVRIVDVPRDGEADLSAEVSAAVESMFGGLAGLDRAPRSKTGVDGDYELADVRVGARRLLVTHKSLVMPASSDVTIVEGGNLHDVALRSTTVRGRVLDQAGAPVAGALVAVSIDVADAEAVAAGVEEARGMFGELFGGSSGEVVRTAADGTFELAGVRPGVPLRVRGSSRQHVADSVRVAAVPVGTVRDGVELRLAAAGRVRVRAAVEGALAVKAEWVGPGPVPKGAASPRSAMLKAGRATFDGLPPGRWKLTLEGSPALEARGLERTVEVVVGEIATVEF